MKARFLKLMRASRPWLISILLAIAIGYFFGIRKWNLGVVAWLCVWAIGVRLVIGAWAAIRRVSRTIPDEYCAPASQDPTTRIVIFQLRTRAARLRVVAHFTLFLILVTLVGGLYIFGWAEQISAGTRLEMIRSLEQEVPYLRNQVVRLEGELNSETDPQKKKVLQRNLDLARSRVENLQSRLAAMTSQPQTDTVYLASLLSTKLGSAFILLFLVQILVTLYRYNVRLASFCDARADVLQLLTTSEHIPLEKVTALLAPEKLDFGKTPPSPMQNALDIAKEIISFRGK